LIEQDVGDAAHTDAANADEMYPMLFVQHHFGASA
jgi:hypothetical protein